MFEVKDVDLAGRIGKLITKHGVVETPAFFPVIDAQRQEISLSSIKELGFNQIITNAYILYKRYNTPVIEKGIHNFLGFDGVIMTDSGAYQILQYGWVDIRNEEIIRFEAEIGTDIGVILDIPTGDVDKIQAEKSVLETIKRAKNAVPLLREYTDTLWVLPVQGGRYLDLVEYSAKTLRDLSGYSIYGIGSPTVFLEKYEYRTVLEIVATAKRYLQPGKPVHLFGAGHPLIIPYAVALGVDLFDSASYILYARDDRVFTDFGVEKLERLSHLPCRCKECSVDIGNLKEMEKKERIRILASHNLCMIKKYLDMTKQAIQEGRLWELLESLSRHHVRIYEAFHYLSEIPEAYSRYSPVVKGIVRGLRVYDSRSLSNPKIQIYHERIESYKPQVNKNLEELILAPLPQDPEMCPEYGDLANTSRYVFYYDPFLMIVPQELCGVYPTIHVHGPRTEIDQDHAETIAKRIVTYVGRFIKTGTKIKVIPHPYAIKLYESLRKLLDHSKNKD